LQVKKAHPRTTGSLLNIYVVFGLENLINIWPGGTGERDVFVKKRVIGF
jgi:hypothetical protein